MEVLNREHLILDDKIVERKCLVYEDIIWYRRCLVMNLGGHYTEQNIPFKRGRIRNSKYLV